MMDLKDKIAANFSAAAPSYDQYAVMQQQAALSLVQRLSALLPEIPEGRVLELGCGTGAVSQRLVALFPQHRLTLVDLAPGMVDQNRQALAPILATPSLIDWQVADAETMALGQEYSLIVSSLTLQWFQDLPATLARLCRALLPGGLLLCSSLGDHSFPEWRGVCRTLNLPCTMNPLPNGNEILNTIQALGYQASAWEEIIHIPYPTVLNFFRSLKKTGTSSAAGGRLSAPQMGRLLSSWQEEAKGTVAVTYQINTFLVRA